MASKLWYYTDFVNPAAWAESADSYRKIVAGAIGYKPCSNTPIRVCHDGIAPLYGFTKGADELAFTPITKQPLKKKGNFYADARAILLEHLDMGSPRKP